jgi:hypothetical protein
LQHLLIIKRKLQNTKPRTKDELLKYIRAFFGFTVPDVRVCPEHSTPGEFISDWFFGKYSKILLIANRGGRKTLLSSVGDVLLMKFKGAGIIHAGAIDAQAKKGYGYVRDFSTKRFRRDLDGEPLMKETKFLNGGHIEVAPMTLNQMAGPHEPILVRDEVDLAKPEALEQSKGIPTSKDGVSIGILDVSSRYFSYGNVETMIQTADEDGRKVHIWCYKETTEPCDDLRSGTALVAAFIDREALHAVSPREYKGFSPSEKDNYQEYQVFDKCPECPIVASCCGDLKRAGGVDRIDDVIQKFQDSAAETWISQHESRRALNEGVIYKHEWKPRYHVIEGWKFPDWKSQRRDYQLFRCLDFGRNRPSVGWILHSLKTGLDIHFHELEPFDVIIPQLKMQIEEIDKKYGLTADDFEATWCDPAGVARDDRDIGTKLQALNQGYDLKAKVPSRIGVWNGIEIVKARLKVINGQTLFQVVKETCPVTIKAHESYHKKKHSMSGMWLNEPEDPQEFEHPMDRIRYFDVGMYGVKRGARIGTN